MNHLLYMDDLKIFAKEEACFDALTEAVRVFSSDIGMEFGSGKIFNIDNEKRESVNFNWNKTAI